MPSYQEQTAKQLRQRRKVGKLEIQQKANIHFIHYYYTNHQRGQQIEGTGIQTKKTTSAYQIQGGWGETSIIQVRVIIIKLISQPTEH